MGGIEREEGVLKLVHPGRYVEIHKEPIKAAQVLEKNPRHCVTRPDVFEYPWIVVRSESILNLGRVFYIVPNRTIYKLIKAKGYSIQPSLHQNRSPKSYVHRHRQVLEPTSPSKSSAGRTPKHQDHCQSDWQQFHASSWDEDETSPLAQEQACDESFERPSEFDSLAVADMITKHESTYKEFKQMSVTDSKSDTDTDDKGYYFSEVSSSKAAASSEEDDALDLGTESKCKKQVTILKPCLRKQDSARKSLHLKVSFFLPAKCEEQKIKVIESTAESQGFFTC